MHLAQGRQAPESPRQAQSLRLLAGSRGAGAGTLWNARWAVAVLTELSEPGHMLLVPVVGRRGEICDFECRSANVSASLVLRCRGKELSGCSLKGLLRGHPQPEAIYKAYERAFLGRRTQLHGLDEGAWRCRHEVRPSPGGLSAVLTDLACVERLGIARKALEAAELDCRRIAG